MVSRFLRDPNLAHLGQWDPQCLESLCPLSNTLASLGCHSPGDIGILNTVDPLASVSNYYLYSTLASFFFISGSHFELSWLRLLYSNRLDTSSNGIYTLFGDPQARNNTLATLGTLQPQASGSLNHIDPLDSVSNYNLEYSYNNLIGQLEVQY